MDGEAIRQLVNSETELLDASTPAAECVLRLSRDVANKLMALGLHVTAVDGEWWVNLQAYVEFGERISRDESLRKAFNASLWGI